MHRAVRRSFYLACLGLSMVALTAGDFRASGQGKAPDISLKAVSYAGLGGIVRQLKGQVVVVDFWADD